MNLHSVLLLFAAVTTTALPSIPLSNITLHLRYQNTPWLTTPGATLPPNETTTSPILSTDYLPLNKRYLILLLDIDVIHPPNATTILHWYQPDLIPNPSTGNKTLIPDPNPFENPNPKPTSNPIPNPEAKYIKPQPPPGQIHRYIFLLFSQGGEYIFPECFRDALLETVEARAGFDVRQFVDVARLGGPVAVNFVRVGSGSDDRNGGGMVSSTAEVMRRTSLWSAPCGIATTASVGTGTVTAGVEDMTESRKVDLR